MAFHGPRPGRARDELLHCRANWHYAGVQEPEERAGARKEMTSVHCMPPLRSALFSRGNNKAAAVPPRLQDCFVPLERGLGSYRTECKYMTGGPGKATRGKAAARPRHRSTRSRQSRQLPSACGQQRLNGRIADDAEAQLLGTPWRALHRPGVRRLRAGDWGPIRRAGPCRRGSGGARDWRARVSFSSTPVMSVVFPLVSFQQPTRTSSSRPADWASAAVISGLAADG